MSTVARKITKAAVPAVKKAVTTKDGSLDPRVADALWRVSPFIGFTGVWGVGGILHTVLDANPVWAALLALGGLGLSLMTLITSRGEVFNKVLNTLTMLFATLWIAGATVWGSFGTMADTMLVFGMILGTAHMLTMGTAGDGQGIDDELIRIFNASKDVWGHGKAKIRKTTSAKELKDNPYRMTYEITVDRERNTGDDLVRIGNQIAARIGTAPDNVVVTPNPDDAGKATVTLIQGNIRNSILPWPGPSNPGATLKDPLQLGVTTDGNKGLFQVPEAHTQVMGMSGSGKSVGFTWNFVAELITRKSKAGRTELWGIDIAKGRQTLGIMEQAFDRLAYTEEDALAMIKDVRKLIRERTNILESEGYTKWEPESSLRYLVVIIEESPIFFDMLWSEGARDLSMQDVTGIWTAARSAGIHMVSSLQMATQGQQPKLIRDNSANRVCFGLMGSGAEYALPSVALANGADPEKWGTSKKGLCYIASEARPEHEWHVPVRTYFITPEEMYHHCSQYPAPGKENWHLENPFVDGKVQFAKEPAKPRPKSVEEEPAGGHFLVEKMKTLEEEAAQVNLNDEIKLVGENISFPNPDDGSFAEKATAVLRKCYKEGVKEISPRELIQATGVATSPQNGSAYLKRMVDNGFLEHSARGKYRLLKKLGEPTVDDVLNK